MTSRDAKTNLTGPAWWRRFWLGELVLVVLTVAAVAVVSPATSGDPGDAAAIPTFVGSALCGLLTLVWALMCWVGYSRTRGSRGSSSVLRGGVGARLTIYGGYDFEPAWLNGKQEVSGRVEKWLQSQHSKPACVVRLDEPLTATGDVRGQRREVTGGFVVLGLRYTGQEWEQSGTVHIELCEDEPEDKPWSERTHGAWVESHATYSFEE